MNQLFYERLIKAARNGELLHYAEIAPLAGLNMEIQADRNRIGELLGEISTYEYEQDRPLLSAIVVVSRKEYPGEGFFNLARHLGCHHGHKEIEDLDFFVQEVKKVFKYWNTH